MRLQPILLVMVLSGAGLLLAGPTVVEAAPTGEPQPFDIEMVSVSSDGTGGDDLSRSPSISVDGRFTAFASEASTLVPGDTNGVADIFVRDLENKVTDRVSISSDGSQGDDLSELPAISADGRMVAFQSRASNLVPGDTNGVRDIFVRDMQTQVTERVSVSSQGAQSESKSINPAISGDGRFVAFQSLSPNLVPGYTNSVRDVFVHDRQTGETQLVSLTSDGRPGNDWSVEPSISFDGRLIAFASNASNLVPDDTNGVTDIFIHDRETGVTERVSLSSEGVQGDSHSVSPVLSADGRFIAFRSVATNLVPGDTNIAWDIFVHERETGVTERVSVTANGEQVNDFSLGPSVSGDGRFLAFQSWGSNLVAGDTNVAVDVFVRDRRTGLTERVSIGFDGTQGNGLSLSPFISQDGRYVAFQSRASNLVPEDHNGSEDVFLATNPLFDLPVGAGTKKPASTPGSSPQPEPTPVVTSPDGGACSARAGDGKSLDVGWLLLFLVWPGLVLAGHAKCRRPSKPGVSASANDALM